MATKSNVETDKTVLMGHSHVFLPISASLMAVIATLNALTLVTLATTPKLQTIPNMYIASLAVADLFVAATQAVLVAWQHPISHRVFEDCRALCLFLQCLCSAVEASSILSVLLITMDRYVYIEYPFFYARVVTRTKVKVVIAVSWIICILSTLLCRVVIGIFVDRDFDGCDVYAMLYESSAMAFFNGIAFLVICIIICVLYGVLLRTASRHARVIEGTFPIHIQTVSATSAATGRRTRKAARIKARLSLKAVKRMAGVFFILFSCWLPFFLVGLIGPKEVSVDVVHAFALLGVSNSAANFTVYALADKDFRDAVNKLLRPRLRDRQ